MTIFGAAQVASGVGGKIDRAILKSAMKVTRDPTSPHSTRTLKAALRNDVEDARGGYHTLGDVTSDLQQYVSYRGVPPRRGTIGTQPDSRATSFMMGMDETAEHLGWEYTTPRDYERVEPGTVSRGLTSNPGARAKSLARSQAGMSPKASAIAKRRAILKNMKNRK